MRKTRPVSRNYSYEKNTKLPFILFDGLEEDRQASYKLFCKTCGLPIELDASNSGLSGKTHRFTKKLEAKKPIYEDSQLLKCSKAHLNYAQYKYEEKQPMRYILTLTKLMQIKRNWVKRLLEALLVVALLSILPIAFAWIHYSFINEYSARKTLEQSGKTTSAQILSKYHSSGSYKSVDRYELTYQYMVDGQNFRSKKQVDYNTYFLSKEGSSSQIFYLPDQPNKSDLVSNDQLSLDIFIIILLDIMILGVVVFILIKFMLNKKNKLKIKI